MTIIIPNKMNQKTVKQLATFRKKVEALTKLTNELTEELQNLEQNVPKHKNTKDPNAPKRPSTAWIFFYKENVKKVKEEDSSVPTKQICSTLSEKWKGMTDAQKEKYNKLAMKDKQRYQREKEQYENTTTTQSSSSTQTKKTQPKKTQTNKTPAKKTTKKQEVDELTLDDNDDFDADDLNLSDDGDF